LRISKCSCGDPTSPDWPDLAMIWPRYGQRRRYQVSQLVGARNSRPAPEVAKVVGTFVEEINNRARVATMVGAVDYRTGANTD
jgi:hypothetical protein